MCNLLVRDQLRESLSVADRVRYCWNNSVEAKMKRSLWSLALMALLPVQSLCQDCSKFVVLDKYSSTSNYTVYEKTKDAICKETISDKGSASNAGFAAGIPIPVLDDIFSLKLNGSTAANDWSHWKEHFCQSNYYEQYVNLQSSNLSQIFSDNARSIVEECFKNQNEAVYGYFEVPPDGSVFTFTFRVVGKEKLKAGFVKPTMVVSNCDPDNPFGLSWYYRNIGDLDISGQKEEFGCSWDSSKSLHVDLKLANQGARSYILPAIIKRPVPPTPPPAQTWHTEDKDGRPYLATWQFPANCNGNYGLLRVDDTHRCDIERTQIHVGGDTTGYDTWSLWIDAPQGALVYDVSCVPMAEHIIQVQGISQGQTGLCTGLINGGVGPIRMSIKWKQLW